MHVILALQFLQLFLIGSLHFDLADTREKEEKHIENKFNGTQLKVLNIE